MRLAKLLAVPLLVGCTEPSPPSPTRRLAPGSHVVLLSSDRSTTVAVRGAGEVSRVASGTTMARVLVDDRGRPRG